MKNIMMAIRSLTKRGRHNEMKIISLALGLAVGFVLISKVCFERAFDDFYPDTERVYQVYEKALLNGKLDEFERVSGGTVVGMREMMPEIESSTRITWAANGPMVMSDTKRKIDASFWVGDSCLFDILPRPIIAGGDPKEILSRPMYCLISSELAEKIGGDVVGKSFELDTHLGTRLTIGGVFEAFPENSSLRIDGFIAMPSLGEFRWDGSMNYVGNDAYTAFIKLRPGAAISGVEKQIQAFREKYQPIEELKKMGVEIDYTFYPIRETHLKDETIQRMNVMLSLIALALIFTAVMNYVLIVISSLVGRAKEVAVRKCYGAGSRSIHGIIFSEAVVHLAVSIILAILLVLACRETVEELVGVSLLALVRSAGPILLAVCVVVLLATGLLPGYLYSRIPVSVAFRAYRESKRYWKLGLLFIQFIAAAFLVILLAVVARQYDRMTNDDPGYRYDDLAYVNTRVIPDSSRIATAMAELRRLPEVKSVAATYGLPMNGASGNNVSLPGDEKELFNLGDLYYVTENYFEMMEIPIIEGRTFNPALRRDEEVMVSRRFAEQLRLTAGWSESEPIVGKSIQISEHTTGNKTLTICGIYENFRVGSIAYEDPRGTAYFYHPTCAGYLLIRFNGITPEKIAKAEAVLTSLFPDKELRLYSYADEMRGLYKDTRKFRDSILIGGLVTLAILFIGLIGYTTDEVNRRRKEMAIRRINGATLADVLRLFLKDISRILLPATLIGAMAAYAVAGLWQEQFSEKVPLSWYLFVGGVLLVIAIVLGIASLNIHKAANDNPAENLKSE